MSSVVPMIRAAAAMPLLRWLHQNGHRPDSLAAEVDLPALPYCDPMQPIPLLAALDLLRRASELEGPDICCRVVSETSALELLLLGKVALGTRTPREAVMRIAAAIPFFCSHEHLTIDPVVNGAVVSQFYAMDLPPTTLHLVHQYVAEMTRTLCRMTGEADPVGTVEMVPHPEFGLDHLRVWFGDRLVPTERHSVSVFVSEAILDKPFPSRARDRTGGRVPPGFKTLRDDPTLSGSARILIGLMLDDGSPSVDRLAAYAGMSIRTLQRRLDAEGTNFTILLDEVRKSRALDSLAAGGGALSALSEELGYARQASLTRAVRRWTGQAPRHLRVDATR
ncbi:MAG: AraC family transcriptional regulator [Bauldia litoralis]